MDPEPDARIDKDNIPTPINTKNFISHLKTYPAQIVKIIMGSDFYKVIGQAKFELQRLISLNSSTPIQALQCFQKEFKDLFDYYSEVSKKPENPIIDIEVLPSIPEKYANICNYTTTTVHHIDFVKYSLPIVKTIIETKKGNHHYKNFTTDQLTTLYQEWASLLNQTKQFFKTIIIYHQINIIDALNEEFNNSLSPINDQNLCTDFQKTISDLNKYIEAKSHKLRDDTDILPHSTDPYLTQKNDLILSSNTITLSFMITALFLTSLKRLLL